MSHTNQSWPFVYSPSHGPTGPPEERIWAIGWNPVGGLTKTEAEDILEILYRARERDKEEDK